MRLHPARHARICPTVPDIALRCVTATRIRPVEAAEGSCHPIGPFRRAAGSILSKPVTRAARRPTLRPHGLRSRKQPDGSRRGQSPLVDTLPGRPVGDRRARRDVRVEHAVAAGRPPGRHRHLVLQPGAGRGRAVRAGPAAADQAQPAALAAAVDRHDLLGGRRRLLVDRLLRRRRDPGAVPGRRLLRRPLPAGLLRPGAARPLGAAPGARLHLAGRPGHLAGRRRALLRLHGQADHLGGRGLACRRC